MSGFLALVISAHVPYLRSAGPRPDGEDRLHEMIADVLIPLFNTLGDLRDLGAPVRVALACSPILLEQLADPVVQKHCMLWMDERLARARDDLARAERAGDQHRVYLARFYLDWEEGLQRSFVERYGRNLLVPLRALCAEGLVEPLSGAATHAYLPLMRDEGLRAQLDIGSLSCTQRLGQRPPGLWLPECGYHPRLLPYLSACDARYVILDPTSLNGDTPDARPRRLGTPHLAGFARDAALARQIWSPDLGYQGDPLFRSARRDPDSGFGYWRQGVRGDDEPYDPYHAFQRAREHAAHFARLLAAGLDHTPSPHEPPPIAVITCDASLMGGRWFEGITWLRALLEQTARHPALALTSPGDYLRSHPPRYSAPSRPGDWSEAGGAREWSGAATLPLWLTLQQAEERLAAAIRATTNTTEAQERALAQALREILLAQSSDWSLLLTRMLDSPEALTRPLRHLQRCERLCDLVDLPWLTEEDLRFLDEVEELDNPFPNLNYRVFAS